MFSTHIDISVIDYDLSKHHLRCFITIVHFDAVYEDILGSRHQRRECGCEAHLP